MKSFPKLVDVKAMPNYQLWVSYNDGKAGSIDLSNLQGKGVFKAWDVANGFANVHIDDESGAIAWNEQLDICPDTVYLKLIGKTFEEYAAH